MSYLDQRDAVLVHAEAAALAANPQFTNVAVGWPYLSGSKGCRVFYGGEGEAPQMPNGMQKSFEADLIGEHVALVAWWAVSNLADGLAKAIDTEMFTFKHELRGRITADHTLGGDSTSIEIDYIEPDTVVVGNTRYALIGADIAVGITEYPYEEAGP
jgi:hypothetical protein